MTAAAPRSGARSPSRLRMTEPTSSPVATTGLPAPAVSAVDVTRKSDVLTCARPAAPPPATMASVHRSSGGRSGVTAAIAIMPAVVAIGVAIVSRALSSQGT